MTEPKSTLHLKLVKCRSIGVVPLTEGSPVLFFDIDDVTEETRMKLLQYANLDNSPLMNPLHQCWAIYKTHHGYHLVMKTDSWNETRAHLILLRNLFHSDYMSTDEIEFSYMVKEVPSTMRLRVDRKWLLNGNVTCSAPYKIESCPCYKELRTGIKEVYDTYD